MINSEEIEQNLEKIYDNNSSLNTLIDFENLLDSFHIYAYKNWIEGEIIKGPEISRYWIEVSLIYPYEKMPDPDGSLRLTYHGCKVSYSKQKYIESVEIKTPDDMTMKSNTGKRKPKTKKTYVWFVNIKIPRHLIDEFESGRITVNGVEINMTDISRAKDQNIDTVKKSYMDNENDI